MDTAFVSFLQLLHTHTVVVISPYVISARSNHFPVIDTSVSWNVSHLFLFCRHIRDKTSPPPWVWGQTLLFPALGTPLTRLCCVQKPTLAGQYLIWYTVVMCITVRAPAAFTVRALAYISILFHADKSTPVPCSFTAITASCRTEDSTYTQQNILS